MVFSTEIFASGRYMVFRTRGEATVAGLVSGFATVFGHPDYTPGMGVLADHRAMTLGGFGFTEMRTLASRQRQLLKGIGQTPIATVVSSAAMYGMARMWTALSDHGAHQAFRTAHEAESWLQCQLDEAPPRVASSAAR